MVCKLMENYKPADQLTLKTSAVAGKVLMKGGGDGAVAEAKTKLYRFATANCMYMVQWSCPDIINAVHRLARQMTAL